MASDYTKMTDDDYMLRDYAGGYEAGGDEDREEFYTT
jgi:hypothetical protein